MSLKSNRRSFLLHSLKAAGGLTALGALGSCSTFDEYLFEDTFILKNETIIIGGGLSGLCLGYKLRENKSPFRLYEGASRLGGRICSTKSFDFGASVYTNKDTNLSDLIKKLNLQSAPLEKDSLFLPQGMQALTDQLYTHIAGLIPYRTVRLRWVLVSLQKLGNYYETVFDGPQGKRTFISKKIALAIPPNQWSRILGLAELPEMKNMMAWQKTIRKENILKVILTPQQLYSLNTTTKNIANFSDEKLSARLVVKKSKSANWVEIDLKSKISAAAIPLEQANEFIKKRMNITFTNNKMTTENYFDWSQVELINGSEFKTDAPFPENKNPYFQVVGDFANSIRPGSLEGAVTSAIRSAEILA